MAKLIASIYANSLFEVAKEINKEELIKNELSVITDMFIQDDEFYQFFISPKIPKEERKIVFENIYGGRVSEEVINFIHLLLDKQRASEIIKINKFYSALYDESKNLKRVTAETAVKMTEEQKQKLIEKLEKTTESEIILENIVNPKLLGGIVMKVGNDVIDNSVSTKLKEIGDSITKIII